MRTATTSASYTAPAAAVRASSSATRRPGRTRAPVWSALSSSPTAWSMGTTAIGEAAEVIKRGDCTAVITGASESPILELVHIGFTNMRGMGTPLPGQPISTVSRPFDRTRDGFVLGEGAGALILEDMELA